MKEVIIKNFYDNILDFIYPPVCGICGKLNQNYLCKKCQKVLENQSKFVIDKNKDFNQNFDKHLYIFKYEGIIRRMILNYKFNEKSYLYITFVNFLLKNEKFFKILKSYDTIIPVPISSERKNERGYNQSELLARGISRVTGIPLCTDAVVRSRNNATQTHKSGYARWQNVDRLFLSTPHAANLHDKHILLVDDVLTTGATLVACADALLGVENIKISVLTLAWAR